MKRFPIKVILLSLFIVINLTVICTFPTSMSDNDSEEVVNNPATFLNKNDITVSPTIIDKETKKVSSATLQNFIEDRDAFAKNILGAKKEVTKNGETQQMKIKLFLTAISFLLYLKHLLHCPKRTA